MNHRGTYKYVLTKNDKGTWRVSVINATGDESDPVNILAILEQCVENCKALIPPS